jgi:hypothetical protein
LEQKKEYLLRKLQEIAEESRLVCISEATDRE